MKGQQLRFNELRVNEISESTKDATCVKLSRDKRWLAVGYADGVIRLFDRKSDESNCVIFSGHKKGVNCLEFSDDGLTLASGGKDCAVILWDVVSESGLFRLNGHKAPITHLQFVRGDQFLVTSSKDCLIKFWSLKSQSCFYTVLESRTEVYSFSIVNNETLMVVASAEAELVVYQLVWLEEGILTSSKESSEPEEKKALTESGADGNSIEDMANVGFSFLFRPFQFCVVPLKSYGIQRYLRVIVRGRLLRQCKGRALQLALSPDERFLLCLGADRVVDIYRVFTGAESSKRLAKKLKSAKRKATSEATSIGISEEDVKKDVTILIAPAGEYRTQAKIKWTDFTTKCKVDQDGALNYSVFALMANNTVHLLNFKCDLSSNNVAFECASTVDHLGHRSDIRGLSVASSNNAIVSGGGDELIIWNVHSLRPVACLRTEGMVDVTASVFATGDGHVVAGTKVVLLKDL
ncbi:WD domain, G-beta repeat protein [Ancylostoma caninum]|uniref:WD domain, G-beta repeat protein n=1 Tax=Ancylostoma caninum TaxID=29170 RepID=A0A368FVV7_ANCCA|nr:WD domain, G-beta repeat protein [Ancylostoma caninum]